MASERGWITATGGPRDRAASERSGQTLTETDVIRLAQLMEMEGDLHTVLRRQHVTSHVRDDLTDSERVARKSGVRRVTTRHVRQTTTITRGETRSVTENVSRLGGGGSGQDGMPYHHHHQQQYYHHYATSERDGSLREERVQVPAIAYRPIPPQRTHKRVKVLLP